MKKVKALACVLTLAMLAGVFAGCSKTTKLSTAGFVKACEKMKLEEFELEGRSPDIDDLEDGIYAYADEEDIEDAPDQMETLLRNVGLSEVIDVDDVVSFGLAAKCIGVEDVEELFEDINDPDDLADAIEDLKVDGAFAFQMQFSDDGYAEDVMGYIEDMLEDVADVNTKDLTAKEFFSSKKEGFVRFHIDIAKLGKLALDNDDIMDLIGNVYDEDDFEDLVNNIKGDIAISIEVNGSNLFVVGGVAVNQKASVLNEFVKNFGAATNPAGVPMNEKVVEELLDFAYDALGSIGGGSAGYDDWDDYDDLDDYDDWDEG